MNKQPIKRNENMVRLSKEHHFSLLFCWKIRQGLKYEITHERITKYAQFFRSAYLEPHFREEENIVFTLLKSKQVQKAIEDHKLIREQFDLITRISNDNAIGQLLDLITLIDDHVRYEERKLFPDLEKSLSNEQLEQIGKQLEASPPLPLVEEYADEFWIKNQITH